MKKHHIVTVAITLIYLTHRFLLHSPIPYFNDVICIPVISGISLICMNYIFKNVRRLSIYQVAFIVIYISVVFEFVLPQFNKYVTADLVDIFCYQIGGIIYYLIINPKEIQIT